MDERTKRIEKARRVEMILASYSEEVYYGFNFKLALNESATEEELNVLERVIANIHIERVNYMQSGMRG